MFDRRLLQNFDWALALMTYVLAGIGLLTIYSAMAPTVQGGATAFVYRQALWFAFGSLALVVAFIPHYNWLDRWVWVLYALCIFLLIWVLFFGKTVSGARRWISLGPFTLQPSELVKLAVIVVLAHLYSESARESGLSLGDLVKPAIFVLLPFVLILLEPDLGGALMLLLIGGSMTLFVKVRRRAFAWLVGFGAAAAPLAWFLLKDYQKQRIFTFLNPDRDPLGAGYHIIQSKIAIGSGGLTGKGYLDGSQKALAYLPEQHTDFIFSVFAEEWGLAGSSALLFLFLVFLGLGLNIAFRSKDPFGTVLAVGVVVMIFWQAFINVGMVMGLMPVVGVPMPLVSYGGSSVLTTMIGIGLLLSVGMRRFMFE
jgi:rod shape determining protein RodA